MSTPRRYDQNEVAEILRRATEAETAPAGPTDPAVASRMGDTLSAGLTLEQIREIAGEVGITPASVDRAALALDAAPARPPARFLGAPRSVSQAVEIDRALTDDEWHRLVALLRDTFGAPGKVEELGPLRTWYNGNLQVHVEPWEDRYRVRMQTLKGTVNEMTIVALSLMVVGLIMGVAVLSKRGLHVALLMPLLFETIGLGMIGATRFALPRWADERAAQFEAIAGRLPRLMASGEPDALMTPSSSEPDA